MSSLVVAKFGGTSMATGHSFGIAGQRVGRNQDMRVIVISAPGEIKGINDGGSLQHDRNKVTNRLIRIAEKARLNAPLEEDIAGVEKRFGLIEDAAGLGQEDRVSSRVRSDILLRAKMADGGHIAPISALGEEWNARLFSSYLAKALKVRARYLDPMDAGFVVHESGGKHHIRNDTHALIRKKVQARLDEGGRVIVPGFFGYDLQGAIQTFERGGGDYTGSVLASALGAGLYQNFTDTDGIRVVEPEVAEDAPVIRMMTHRELTELTQGGKFGVFQYDATVPIAISGTPTQVLNTFDMGSRGTYVLPQTGQNEYPVAGIVHRGEFVAFELVKYGIANEVGAFGKLLALFKDAKVSVEHAPTSVNDITVIVRRSSMKDGTGSIEGIVSGIRDVMDPNDLKVHELSAVTIVGEEVNRTATLAARIFRAVGGGGISVAYHSHQGISFIMWVRNGDGEKTAKIAYNEIFGNP